ncbi:ArnT family glycosyltransferase [Actinopolymorpha alba]|uniref:ArnT family glycosyltransferase n=1 Tax=Actinopolymorpha alba TaxID=533267 RepID=UPI000366AFB5|nr:hypothetical protein [Actinopolymorpha alba]
MSANAVTTAVDVPQIPAAGRPRSNRWGWLGVLALTATVAATWFPFLNAPYGDNHEGRVFSRFALQIRNLYEHGLLGSQFATDMAPYVGQLPAGSGDAGSSYAHHPPLATILDALFGLLPGDGEYQMRLAPYLLGLLVIPAAAALLRAFDVRWVPILLALGLMVATGFFWFYARIVFDLGPLLALSAVIAHLRRRTDPPTWLLWLACVVSFLACLASWLGIALAGVLGLWLLATWRRIDRATVAVGAAMVAGVLGSLAFMFGVAGAGELSQQAEFRTEGGTFTAREFAAQQWQWLRNLLPVWYLLFLPVGVLAGLIDRRTRFYTFVAAAFAIGWVVALPNGSYIHDYWPYPVLIPGVIGMAVLLDAVWSRLPRPVIPVGAGLAGVAGLALAVAFAGIVTGPMAQEYTHRPIDAGRLVSEHGPAPGQERAWSISFGAVRWLAYYWDLHPGKVNPQTVREGRPDDLVLIHLDRIPDWLRPGIRDHLVAREGRYALVRISDVRANLTRDALSR